MIQIIKVSGHEEGNRKAHELLKVHLSKKSLLVMCGGLYTNYKSMIVEPNDLLIGAACMGDERYGEQFHMHSNELLIKNFGAISYFEKKGIEFYKILNGLDVHSTAKQYNLIVTALFDRFPERVGIMGIGADVHTAGIFPQSLATHSPDNVVEEAVASEFSERITMTSQALSQFTTFVVMTFGDKKIQAVKTVLDETEVDVHKYPAVFYRTSPIRSYLITDVNV